MTAATATRFTPGLPFLLALRSLHHHRMVAAATILGVAIGMTVVCAILIVDNNTHAVALGAHATGATMTRGGAADSALPATALRMPRSPLVPDIDRIAFDRAGPRQDEARSLVPTQRGGGSGTAPRVPSAERGSEDYAAMRLAVRLASLLAFLVGAVIVFYTMRFSVAARAREFCLLVCLGESRAGVALSLVAEALVLGLAGAVLGLILALPAGQALLASGISTTGQMPAGTAAIPWGEIVSMGLIGVAIALMGVAGPVRVLYRMEIAQVLQPRFLDDAIGRGAASTAQGLAWLLPSATAAAYLLIRPFLISWLSVVHFFLFEAAFVCLLAAATLWWVRPLMDGAIALFERILRPFLPLETLLAGRRMRLAARQITFAVTGIVLVFGMLTALHDITRALKDEIVRWAAAAMAPYVFYERTSMPFDARAFGERLAAHGLIFTRMSERIPGALPMRIVHSADINPGRARAGRSELRPGRIIVSRTLAARHDLRAGDRLVIEGRGQAHRFEIIEVTDDVGFYAEDGRYVDLRSYVIFSEGNPLFAGNLETTLGRYGTARFADGALPLSRRLPYDALYPFYLRTTYGMLRGYYQTREIDRDFRIFDFILAMTVLLAAIGVANTLLIQVHARGREFSVLRTIGMDRAQVARMLLAEGLIVGLVGAALAAVVGHALGAVSVAFLDHFTLFDYAFRISPRDTALFSALCVATCCVAAIYPAMAAVRTSSSESLHYE